MRHIARNAALLAVLYFSPQAVFAHKDIEPKDPAEAINWIQEALRSFSNVKIAENFIIYEQRDQSYSIALPRIPNVSSTEQKRNSYPYCVFWRDYASNGPTHICWGVKGHKNSERFGAALNIFRPMPARKRKLELTRTGHTSNNK
jgi:hypothetical protein